MVHLIWETHCRGAIVERDCTDHKNNHRKGYNIFTVYSYVATLNGDDYKVSVIMTTCTTFGSACDKGLRKSGIPQPKGREQYKRRGAENNDWKKKGVRNKMVETSEINQKVRVVI